MHSVDQEYMKNNILRVESREFSIRNRISEELARSELEAMDRDAQFAFLYQDQQLKIAVRENQRQAREAVSQAVQESSESYDVLMMQEFQGVQTHMKDDWKNMIGGWHK